MFSRLKNQKQAYDLKIKGTAIKSTNAALSKILRMKTFADYQYTWVNGIKWNKFKQNITDEDRLAVKMAFCFAISSSLASSSPLSTMTSSYSLVVYNLFDDVVGKEVPLNESTSEKILSFLKRSTTFTGQLSAVDGDDFENATKILVRQLTLTNVNDVNTRIQGLATNVDEGDIYDLLALLAVRYKKRIRRHYIMALFALLMAVTRQRNCTSRALTRRLSALAAFLGEQSVELTINEISGIWNLIEDNLKKADIEQVLHVLSNYAESTECVVITPLIVQAQWRNLTCIKLIYDAIQEYSDFPWGFVLREAKVLYDEMANFSKYLSIIGGDTYAGFKYSGVATMFPNLACLCYNLHMRIGGKNTLQDYNGIGSDRSNCSQREIVKRWVENFKEQRLSSFAKLPDQPTDDDRRNPFILPVIQGLNEDDDDDNSGGDDYAPPSKRPRSVSSDLRLEEETLETEEIPQHVEQDDIEMAETDIATQVPSSSAFIDIPSVASDAESSPSTRSTRSGTHKSKKTPGKSEQTVTAIRLLLKDNEQISLIKGVGVTQLLLNLEDARTQILNLGEVDATLKKTLMNYFGTKIGHILAYITANSAVDTGDLFQTERSVQFLPSGGMKRSASKRH